MGIFARIRERLGSAFGAVLAAICFLALGAVMAFVISPQQAAEWRRIQNLPELTASSFAGVQTGEAVAITGKLEDNDPLNVYEHVAYTVEEWQVEPPDEDDSTADGSWSTIETVVPELNVSISGGTVRTTAVNQATLGGGLDEIIDEAYSRQTAKYDGRELSEGSLRIRGFRDGNLVTVVGKKGSSGDLVPDRLYAGDRVELVDSIRASARTTFVIGIVMMVISPLVLVGGILAAIFGKRRAARIST
ncbi:MAG: hypothetical protein JXJ17_05335 [Anaerolineae bacterium]|nr:hypothetical protein [Anaerolineae bacterium]